VSEPKEMTPERLAECLAMADTFRTHYADGLTMVEVRAEDWDAILAHIDALTARAEDVTRERDAAQAKLAAARTEALRHAHARLIAWSAYIRHGGWLGQPTEIKNDSDMAVRAAHEVYAMIGKDAEPLDAELATEVASGNGGLMGKAWWVERIRRMVNDKKSRVGLAPLLPEVHGGEP